MFNYEVERNKQRTLNEAQIRKKECENKTFKLVGIINIFRIYPSFVFPVFVCQQDGKEYMQEGDENTLTLNSFFPIEQYRDLKNVVYLDTVNKNDFSPPVFTINSEPVFAFQVSEDNCFIGYAKQMKEFLKNFTTENEILKEEIEDFMKLE